MANNGQISDVGTFDTLIKVRSCEIVTGAQGQKKYMFTDRGYVFAAINRNVDESVDNGNLESGQTLVVSMYKIQGLTTRWQFIIDGKSFAVQAIDPIDRTSPVCNVTVTAIDG